MKALLSNWRCKIPILTVRNLSEEVHRALLIRAAQRGVSAEAEVRAIIAAAVMPTQRVRLGAELVAIGAELGLTNADIQKLEKMRDKTPAVPPGL
jgi:antitoxin FitA